MAESLASARSREADESPGAKLVGESRQDAGLAGSKAASREFEAEAGGAQAQTVVVKKAPSSEFPNFHYMVSDTPVCHLLFEDIDNGSFYLQWKPDSSERFANSVAMMAPKKSVPKFKLTVDGGRAPLSHKVAPDKMKFYSYLCQFLKLVRDHDARFQLLPAWHTDMPYKCDLYLHYEDNRVHKVGDEHAVLDNVNCVAVVGTSVQMSSRMTREQFATRARNVGHALTF